MTETPRCLHTGPFSPGGLALLGLRPAWCSRSPPPVAAWESVADTRGGMFTLCIEKDNCTATFTETNGPGPHLRQGAPRQARPHGAWGGSWQCCPALAFSLSAPHPQPASLLHSASASCWGRRGLPQGADQSLEQCKQLGSVSPGRRAGAGERPGQEERKAVQ